MFRPEESYWPTSAYEFEVNLGFFVALNHHVCLSEEYYSLNFYAILGLQFEIIPICISRRRVCMNTCTSMANKFED